MNPSRAPRSSPSYGTSLAGIARNVSTRYVAILVEALLGLVILPYNVGHLGRSAYGLWMIAASVTAYFSVLDLGYGGALTKFVAQYRARKDPAAINEILSTLFFVFAAIGLLAWAAAAVVAWNLGALFHLPAEEARSGRLVLLIITLNVAAGFPFSVFGGATNGFQRYDLNNLVGAVSSALAAAVNVAVLAAGLGLVPLVAATTGVRLLTYFGYRWNAYRVFPELRIRPSLFRRARLREVTEFSIFVALLDWASKVNYSVDAIVIGSLLGTAPVAVWTVAQRLVEGVQRLTSQVSDVLFPAVVDTAAGGRPDLLRLIFVQGTRLSLACVLPLACTVGILAHPIIGAWVGAGFETSAVVAQVLAAVVVLRVGTSTAFMVLKGAGGHRLLAYSNVAAAIVNLLLSITLAPRLGLLGVAVGTLVPVALACGFVVFPAAYRRVGLDVRSALRAAVWPAAWPALVMSAWLAAVRAWVHPALWMVAGHAALAAAVYLGLFVCCALPAAERRIYFAKAAALLSRTRRMEAAA